MSASGLRGVLSEGNPTLRTLVRLARAGGVPLLWLATGEGPRTAGGSESTEAAQNLGIGGGEACAAMLTRDNVRTLLEVVGEVLKREREDPDNDWEDVAWRAYQLLRYLQQGGIQRGGLSDKAVKAVVDLAANGG